MVANPTLEKDLPSPALVWCVTCMMDSKLKEMPFHRVNSPLTAPVISLLPSGTHCGRGKKRVIGGGGGSGGGGGEREKRTSDIRYTT